MSNQLEKLLTNCKTPRKKEICAKKKLYEFNRWESFSSAIVKLSQNLSSDNPFTMQMKLPSLLSADIMKLSNKFYWDFVYFVLSSLVLNFFNVFFLFSAARCKSPMSLKVIKLHELLFHNWFFLFVFFI